MGPHFYDSLTTLFSLPVSVNYRQNALCRRSDLCRLATPDKIVRFRSCSGAF